MKKIFLTDSSRSSSFVKDQHTTSRFYLNKFADAERKTWVYRKEGEPRRLSTKVLTTEEYFYEYSFHGEVTNNRIERMLQRIESKAGKLYLKLLSRQELTDDECVSWALFVASLFLRSRKWRREMIEPKVTQLGETLCSKAALGEMQERMTRDGYFRTLEQIERSSTEYYSHVLEQPSYLQLKHLEESLVNFASVILSKSWHVISAAPKMHFYSCDAPVSSFLLDSRGAIFGGHGFGKPDVVAVLPLNPNKIWFAGPSSVGWPEMFCEQNMILFNRLTISFAHEMVFSRDKDLSAKLLADAELGSTTFGVNAFTSPTLSRHMSSPVPAV